VYENLFQMTLCISLQII